MNSNSFQATLSWRNFVFVRFVLLNPLPYVESGDNNSCLFHRIIVRIKYVMRVGNRVHTVNLRYACKKLIVSSVANGIIIHKYLLLFSGGKLNFIPVNINLGQVTLVYGIRIWATCVIFGEKLSESAHGPVFPCPFCLDDQKYF